MASCGLIIKHETTPRANYCRLEGNYKFDQPYFVSRFNFIDRVISIVLAEVRISPFEMDTSNVKFQNRYDHTIQQLYLFFFLDRSYMYVCVFVCVCTRTCVYPRAFSVMQVQMSVLGVSSNNNSGNRSE